MTTESLTIDVLRQDIARVLDEEPVAIAEGADLLDLGLDSVRLMLLADRWSARTGRTVEFAVLAEEPELGAWWRYLAGGGG